MKKALNKEDRLCPGPKIEKIKLQVKFQQKEKQINVQPISNNLHSGSVSMNQRIEVQKSQVTVNL